MPIITTAAITLIAKQLAEKGLEKAFDISVEDISKDALTWIKSVFKKDGKVKTELIELQDKPNSPARLNAVNAIFEKELEDNPEAIKYFTEIFEKLSPNIKIESSKNVNIGNISTTTGNIQLGDNNAK